MSAMDFHSAHCRAYRDGYLAFTQAIAGLFSEVVVCEACPPPRPKRQQPGPSDRLGLISF
jgi:hypothetical protein